MRMILIGIAVFAGSTAAKADFGVDLARAAEERATHRVIYDPSYRAMSYPMGDVADDRGVCSDVVIRALRGVGADLQQLIHEDMKRNFSAYPSIWGLTRTDRNIDHRRVPNIETFLTRVGAALPAGGDADAFLPGDIVSWRLAGSGLAHIGVVTTRRAPSGALMIAHNIGAGTVVEDMLFDHPITGHFRYRP